MTIQEFIETSQKTDLSKLGYLKMKHLIVSNSIQFPYTTALIKKGATIERGRVNDSPFYNSEFEISYRTDYGNIREFGRANKPYESMFYGAMSSGEIKLARIILFSELVKEFTNIPTTDVEITMTIGRWVAKEDFEVADVCFSENYFNNNEIKERYENWKAKMIDFEIGQIDYQNLLIFFADEFSKKEIKTHHDYKLACLYKDFAIHSNKLCGICYPSVRTDYKAYNIALTPDTVERYLELKQVAMFKYEVKDGNAKLFPIYYSDDLGLFNTNFNWRSVTDLNITNLI